MRDHFISGIVLMIRDHENTKRKNETNNYVNLSWTFRL